jgi:nucleoside-diphosphate-sugar epimerase
MLERGIVARGTDRRNRPDIPDVDWRAISYLDGAGQWPKLMANMEVVVHLAALAHQVGRAAQGRWHEFQRINVQGTRVVAHAYREAGIRRIIFVSSIAVYAPSATLIDEQTAMRPQDDFGRSKLEAEQALRSELSGSATDWCSLRPPSVLGRGGPSNMPRLQSLVGGGFPLPFGGINSRRSFIFVDNLVDAIVTVLRCPHGIRKEYVLSDGSDFATPELISVLATSNHRSVRLLNVPVNLLKLIGRAGDLTGRILGIHTGLDSQAIYRLSSRVVDASRFRTSFDWHPPIERARALELTYGVKKQEPG